MHKQTRKKTIEVYIVSSRDVNDDALTGIQGIASILHNKSQKSVEGKTIKGCIMLQGNTRILYFTKKRCGI